MVGEFGEALLPFRATFRLRMWLFGVLQIIHPWCKQDEILVQVF